MESCAIFHRVYGHAPEMHCSKTKFIATASFEAKGLPTGADDNVPCILSVTRPHRLA